MASSPTLSSLLIASSFLLAAAAYLGHHEDAFDEVSHGVYAATTHLHFYMHDDYAGPQPTAMRVVSGKSLSPNASAAPPSPRQFGDIVVFNNALTEGPGRDTARVGTAQGFAVRVSERGVVSDLSMYLVLEAGAHRGSSVAVKGRIDLDAALRESVVVGGTGRFRFARGYVLTKNYEYDLAKGGVVEVDVYMH